MKSSVFEIFKTGIGPSSSHAMGPTLAAGELASDLGSKGLLLRTRRVESNLYGSLVLTRRRYTIGAASYG